MRDADVKKMRLLVVDDDTAVRMVLAMELEDVDVLEAWRVATVLEDALSQGADAVLVDRRLPDGDGHDAVRALRAAPETADLPIIVITADDDPAVRERSFAAGADEHIVKPIDAARLLQLIKGIRASSTAERRLRRTVHRARLHVGRDDGGHDDLLQVALASRDARPAPGPGPGPRRRRRGGRGRGKGPSTASS